MLEEPSHGWLERLLHGPGSLGQRGAGIGGIVVDMNIDWAERKNSSVHVAILPEENRPGESRMASLP